MHSYCCHKKSDRTAAAHVKCATQYKIRRFINPLSASQPEAARETVLTILTDDINQTALLRLKLKGEMKCTSSVNILFIELKCLAPILNISDVMEYDTGTGNEYIYQEDNS